MISQVIDWMVARDGIEPSTRGFSGRATDSAYIYEWVGLSLEKLLPITPVFGRFRYLFDRFPGVIRNTKRVGEARSLGGTES